MARLDIFNGLLNQFVSLRSKIDNFPDNSSNVIHIAWEELDGYDLLFNAVFRIRIGWEKVFKLLFIYCGLSPSGGFKTLLTRSKERIQKKYSESDKPVLDSLYQLSSGAVKSIERLRNDEEHNEGIIIQSLANRGYLLSLHDNISYELNRLQLGVLCILCLVSGKAINSI